MMVTMLSIGFALLFLLLLIMYCLVRIKHLEEWMEEKDYDKE